MNDDSSPRTLILKQSNEIYNEVQRSLSQALPVLNPNWAARAFASLLGETVSYLLVFSLTCLIPSEALSLRISPNLTNYVYLYVQGNYQKSITKHKMFLIIDYEVIIETDEYVI